MSVSNYAQDLGIQCACGISNDLNPNIPVDTEISNLFPIQNIFGSFLSLDGTLGEAGLPFQVNAFQDNETGAFGLNVLSGKSGIVASPEVATYSFRSSIVISDVNFTLAGLDNFDQVEVMAYKDDVLISADAIRITSLDNSIVISGNTIASTLQSNPGDPIKLSANYFINTNVDRIELIAGKAIDINELSVDFQIKNICYCPSEQCFTGDEEDLDICSFLALDPSSSLADADCDGGGSSNLFECENGSNPFDSQDDPFVSSCEELICNNDLQISLTAACEYKLKYDDLLEAAEEDNYQIKLFSQNGEFLRDDYLLAEDVGTTVKYQISCGGNSCWGEIIVEANSIPIFDFPCAVREDGIVPTECRILCQVVGPVIGAFVTPEEVKEAFTGCGPDILGDIKVTEEILGDICDPFGQIVEVTYKFKVILHGQIQEVELPKQRFTTIRLSIDDDTILFPEDVSLNCDYLDDLEIPEDNSEAFSELGSPESISAALGIAQTAFISYEDILDTTYNIIDVYDTLMVVVNKIPRDTMVKELIGDEFLWVLKTILVPVFEEKIFPRKDTLGIVNPFLPIKNGACNVLVEFSDLTFKACGGIKILRQWTAVDWCNFDINAGRKQTIEIKDNAPPRAIETRDGKQVIIEQLDDVVIGLEPWMCSGTYKLPEFTIVDDCNRTEAFVIWDSEEGIVKDGYITDVWLSNDPFKVTAKITDECDNFSTVTFNLFVVDDIPPVASCQTSLAVSLTGNQGATTTKVYAADLDEGSHDSGCGKVTVQAIRLDDYREIIRDCNGNLLGYSPTGCSAVTNEITLEASNDKNSCQYQNEQKIITSTFGDYITLCCTDAGKIIQVLVRVTDKHGNINDCIVDLSVSDFSISRLICEDKIITHDQIGLEIIPELATPLCESEIEDELMLLSSTGNLSCPGDVQINEWFIDTDENGEHSEFEPICQQKLTIDDELLFDPLNIHWPIHRGGSSKSGINLECDDSKLVKTSGHTVKMNEPYECIADMEDEVYPYWCVADCGLVGTTVEVDTIKASNVCLKIIKRWRVVDWCVYEANGVDQDSHTDTYEAVEDWSLNDCVNCDAQYEENVYFRYQDVNQDGYYTFDQVIQVIDESNPTIEVDASYHVSVTGENVKGDEFLACSGSAIISASGADFCGDGIINESDLRWDITVAKNGKVILTKTTFGQNATMSSGLGTVGGTHVITWIAKDQCGNVSTKNTIVNFVDTTAPTPICVSGVSTAFYNNNGIVDIWAKDFDFGSFDNCTAFNDLEWSIINEGEEPIGLNDDGFSSQQSVTFHCDKDDDFQELSVFVWDQFGNHDYCTVAILINSENACNQEGGVQEETGAAVVAGSIHTVRSQVIPNVDVVIRSNVSVEFPKQLNTEFSGVYLFANNPLDFNYKVEASKEDLHINGISTLDIVMISRHIIGLASFTSSYDVIASDVNGDRGITASDIVSLRRLILGETETLPTASPWLFIEAEQQFIDGNNPWPFTTDIAITSLSSDMMQQNFMGIKIGDVTGDVNLSQDESETRSKDIIPILVDNILFAKHEIITVEFTVDQEFSLIGTQFDLSHEGLTFIDIQSGSIDIDIENIHTEENHLAVSWDDANFKTVKSHDVLFSIRFKAKKAGSLNEALYITDRRLNAEIYTGPDFEIKNTVLQIEDMNIDVVSQLKNYPNPFSDRTSIEFELPVSVENATIKIFDTSGSLIHTIRDRFQKGINNVLIHSNLLTGPGSYYYTIEYNNQNVSNTMIFSGK